MSFLSCPVDEVLRFLHYFLLLCQACLPFILNSKEVVVAMHVIVKHLKVGCLSRLNNILPALNNYNADYVLKHLLHLHEFVSLASEYGSVDSLHKKCFFDTSDHVVGVRHNM